MSHIEEHNSHQILSAILSVSTNDDSRLSVGALTLDEYLDLIDGWEKEDDIIRQHTASGTDPVPRWWDE